MIIAVKRFMHTWGVPHLPEGMPFSAAAHVRWGIDMDNNAYGNGEAVLEGFKSVRHFMKALRSCPTESRFSGNRKIVISALTQCAYHANLMTAPQLTDAIRYSSGYGAAGDAEIFADRLAGILENNGSLSPKVVRNALEALAYMTTEGTSNATQAISRWALNTLTQQSGNGVPRPAGTLQTFLAARTQPQRAST